MAKAETTELFNCTVEEFWKIVTDYPKYPEFLGEVKSCRVLSQEGQRKLVEYHVSVVKNFKYQLSMLEEFPHSVSWEFISGDIFKSMRGYWKLKDEGGKCRATYFVEATFGMFVPGPIASALVSVNLPNMIASYHKRIKALYGK
ncbi:MAG: SRPBCC family protein [Bdellovibrionaceae bacterium]|nr:SRPBCC family protein [Pseudobdellovibrionaceae bacterium]